jgi:hypothetical protein
MNRKKECRGDNDRNRERFVHLERIKQLCGWERGHPIHRSFDRKKKRERIHRRTLALFSKIKKEKR